MWISIKLNSWKLFFLNISSKDIRCVCPQAPYILTNVYVLKHPIYLHTCTSSSKLYTYKRVCPQAPNILTNVYVLKHSIYLQTCMSSITLYTYKRVCPQTPYILTNVYVLKHPIYLQTCMSSSTLYTYKRVCFEWCFYYEAFTIVSPSHRHWLDRQHLNGTDTRSLLWITERENTG